MCVCVCVHTPQPPLAQWFAGWCLSQAAREHCYFVDSKGLVCKSRTDLQHHKLPFAHDIPFCADLKSAVATIKPTVLIGVSTVAGAFSAEIIEMMAESNEYPIIFPLSNPTSKAECTFQQAFEGTKGKVIFASGSPFNPILNDQGVLVTPAQVRHVCRAQWAAARAQQCASFCLFLCHNSTHSAHLPCSLSSAPQANNAYIFPALGHAASLLAWKEMTDDMFLLAAEAVAGMQTVEQIRSGQLFPPFCQIMDVSARVMGHLMAAICGDGTTAEQWTKESMQVSLD